MASDGQRVHSNAEHISAPRGFTGGSSAEGGRLRTELNMSSGPARMFPVNLPLSP